MKKIGIALIAVGLVLSAVIFTSLALAEGKAEPKQDWSKLKVVTYTSGATGFFDPDTGKLFVYDANMENCLLIRQLVTLGEPMRRLNN